LWVRCHCHARYLCIASRRHRRNPLPGLVE
jgi:hypothetical protein